MESTDSDEYQAAIAPLREHLDTTYRPLVEAYTSALVAGDDSRAAHLAEDLDAAADELETRWTATLFTKAADLPNGVFVNEAAGAMAMLSDQWAALAAAHRERLRDASQK